MLNREVSKIFLVKNKPFSKNGYQLTMSWVPMTKKEGFAEGWIIGAGVLVFFLAFLIKIARELRELTSNACCESLSRGNRWKIRISLTLHSLLIHRIWQRTDEGGTADIEALKNLSFCAFVGQCQFENFLTIEKILLKSCSGHELQRYYVDQKGANFAT